MSLPSTYLINGCEVNIAPNHAEGKLSIDSGGMPQVFFAESAVNAISKILLENDIAHTAYPISGPTGPNKMGVRGFEYSLKDHAQLADAEELAKKALHQLVAPAAYVPYEPSYLTAKSSKAKTRQLT